MARAIREMADQAEEGTNDKQRRVQDLEFGKCFLSYVLLVYIHHLKPVSKHEPILEGVGWSWRP